MRLPCLGMMLIGALFASACGAPAGDVGSSPEVIENPHDGLWQDAAEVPFRFVLEQTFGVEEEPEEAVLATVFSVATDSDGNVYLLDTPQGPIISFDRGGAFRWRTGAGGEGPEEYSNARDLVWDGAGQIYVANQRNQRLDALDLEGRYIAGHDLSRSSLSPAAELAGVFSPARLVFSGPVVGAFAVQIDIVSLSEEPDSTVQLSLDMSDGIEYPASASPNSYVAVVDDAIVVGHVSEYQFDFYNSTGQLNRTVKRELDDLVRPGIMAGQFAGTRFFSTLAAPLTLQDGYHLVYARWPTNIDDPDAFTQMIIDRTAPPIEWELTYDLYDADWNLLYAWTGSADEGHSIGHIYHADSGGKLYVRMQGGYPQIGRYRVEITQPD